MNFQTCIGPGVANYGLNPLLTGLGSRVQQWDMRWVVVDVVVLDIVLPNLVNLK